jgi:hypothetical protein
MQSGCTPSKTLVLKPVLSARPSTTHQGVVTMKKLPPPFFLNFDIAFCQKEAQHLLPLARKVEQGGLNG